ncbi:MAG: nucleotidyltransferase family protein [Methanothrix sp.]|nr:nucleotidyltransferase family protein [Methanothrix sp.]
MIRTDKEVELLVACSRPQVDSENSKRICVLLKEEMDWAWIIKAARTHGVMPLLYRHLKAACPGAVPPEIYLDLQKVYLLNTRRNLIIARELLGILTALRESGIEAVPFKGPALSLMAYGDITCRSFSDLDIMVAKDDVLLAKDVLISRGYRPQVSFTAKQERNILKNVCEYNFVRENPHLLVEIHWRFHTDYYSVPASDGIWSRLESINLEGLPVPSFSADDLVLVLCSHAARHEWAQLKFVSDFAGLISQQQIDWDQVVASAHKMGLLRILHINLFLAQDLLGAKLPMRMINEMGPDCSAKEMARNMSEKLFSGNNTNNKGGPIEKYLFWARTRERMRDRVRYLFFVGFKPTQVDYDEFPMPDFLYPFYWIIRPVRLLCKYRSRKRM